MFCLRKLVIIVGLAVNTAIAISISEIQGGSFKSPYAGQTVHDITGIVIAKDRYGFWLSGEPTSKHNGSHGIRVYGPSVIHQANAGDYVSLSARVTEYRSADRPNDLFLTELDHPTNIEVLSSGNVVKPVVLGEDRIPPRGGLTGLDDGPDGWLSMPNNKTLHQVVNGALRPDQYALDFWESLQGQLVMIKEPTALSFPDRYSSFWVHGDWPVFGKNSRGGLTLGIGPDGIPYAHSETVFIGSPLDGTRNPRTLAGMTLSDIIGVVTYQYGFYYVLPLTAPTATAVPKQIAEPASVLSTTEPCEIMIGDYNVENMSPRSQHIPKIAEHIVNYLNTPDIVFLQEIMDDSGSADNGVVTANKTLGALTHAIALASGGVKYEFTNISPLDNVDGGKPGGNIRVAYLWRPEKVSLVPGSPIGNATEAVKVTKDKDDQAFLTLNPGRINPMNSAWEDTRKPLAAAWQTTTGERFYTVNVHLSSKRDSSSVHGDARPPVNGHSERRTEQVNVVAEFIESILSVNINASIVLAGDMNEFLQTRSIFSSLSDFLTDINKVSGIPPEERYTYIYDQHMQEIDHIFVSNAVKERGTEVEHVHLNTWAESFRARASDHDPTVAKVRVCDVSESRGTSPKFVVQEPMA